MWNQLATVYNKQFIDLFSSVCTVKYRCTSRSVNNPLLLINAQS